jgi:hypothetical protein
LTDVRLARLVTHDIAAIGVALAKREALDGLAAFCRGQCGEQRVRDREDATCVGCLRLILIEGAATNIDACRANPQGSLFEVDVRPALPSDLAAP